MENASKKETGEFQVKRSTVNEGWKNQMCCRHRKGFQLMESSGWGIVRHGQQLVVLMLWNRFLGESSLLFRLSAQRLPMTPLQANLASGCFLEGVPSCFFQLSLAASWKSCLWRILSEGNLRHLMSVKLIMLQFSECLGALNLECSADFV